MYFSPFIRTLCGQTPPASSPSFSVVPLVPLCHFLSLNLMKFAFFFSWWQPCSAEYHGVVTPQKIPEVSDGDPQQLMDKHFSCSWVSSHGAAPSAQPVWCPHTLSGIYLRFSSFFLPSGLLHLLPRALLIVSKSSLCGLNWFWGNQASKRWPWNSHKPVLLLRVTSSALSWLHSDCWLWAVAFWPEQQSRTISHISARQGLYFGLLRLSNSQSLHLA